MDKVDKDKEDLKNERWKKLIYSLIVFIFVYKFTCMQMMKTEVAWISTLGNNMNEYYDAVKDVIGAFIAAAVANKSFSL